MIFSVEFLLGKRYLLIPNTKYQKPKTTMKQIKTFIWALLLALPMISFAQGPVAPSTGIWAIIDASYQVGSTTIGQTKAKLTLRNNTLTKTTGVQFRVFYDKIAFTNASVALLGSNTNLDMQYSTSAANGYITVTLVYTGASSTYTLAEGETFEITFTHAPAATFIPLSISNLTWSGVQTFTPYAAQQDGMDIALSLHNYGGVFVRPTLTFSGDYVNVTGTPAKNLVLKLEKKPKNSSTWAEHNSYTTDVAGHFTFTETIDTTFYDVRIATRVADNAPGNVISTADAQLINQWVLGTSAMSGFDYFTADVNGSNGITISDAYGVFGRVSGRFTSWPNSVKDIKFFTPTEYTAINGSSTNLTSTYAGVTNFYHDIIAGQPDSIVRYVMVPGDANGTGYHMARVTPIEVLINPTPGVESQIYNVIDTRVEYDFPTSPIEVNVPRLTVQEGNIVDIPVKVFTNGVKLNSLQFGVRYDETLLQFKGIYSTSNANKWLTYVNPNDGQIDWGGYDVTDNLNPLESGSDVITMQFIALKPQLQWDNSPLYTTNKFAGNVNHRDLEITPTNGIIQVVKISNNVILIDGNSMEIIPNPVTDKVTVIFNVTEPTQATLTIKDLVGRTVMNILAGQVPEGQFQYNTDLGKLVPGMYLATLSLENGKFIAEKLIKQ